MEELETLESTECPECPGPPPEFRLPPPPRPPFLTEGTFCSESPLAELEDCVAIPVSHPLSLLLLRSSCNLIFGMKLKDDRITLVRGGLPSSFLSLKSTRQAGHAFRLVLETHS